MSRAELYRTSFDVEQWRLDQVHRLVQDLAKARRQNRNWVLTLYAGMMISVVMGAVFGFWLAGGFS